MTDSIAPRIEQRLRQWSVGAVALVGLGGSVLVALAAWGSGVFPRRAHPGSWTSSTPFVPPQVVSYLAWFAGIALLSAGWAAMHARARGPGVTVGRVVLVVVLWAVPLLAAPPVGSRDVYSYAAHGELVTQGYDPGVAPPWTLGIRSPFRNAVDPLWRGVVSAYGPASSGLAELTVEASDHDVTRTVLGLRLWMVGGVVLMGIGAVVLARHSGRDPVDALVLTVANPLTLVHLVGGAHNEALMAGLMMVGLALFAARPGSAAAVGGSALIALGAAVKAPALLAVVYIGWRYDGRPVPLWVRAGRTLGLLAVALAVMQAVNVVTGLSWGWLDGVTAGSNVTTLLSVSTTAALLLRWLILPLGVDRQTTLDAVRALVQWLGIALAAVLVWRTPRLGLLGLGGAFAVLAATGASVHPWYFAWALPVLAVALAGSRATAFLLVSALVTISTRPEGGGLTRNAGFVPWLVVPLLVLGLALWWWRRASPTETTAPPARPQASSSSA
jgi:hypothetical protein